MKNGTVSENGTYKTLMDNKGDFADFVRQFSKNENHKTNEGDDETPIQRTLSMSEGGDTIRQLSVDKIHREDKKRITGDERTETGNSLNLVNAELSNRVSLFMDLNSIWVSIRYYPEKELTFDIITRPDMLWKSSVSVNPRMSNIIY